MAALHLRRIDDLSTPDRRGDRTLSLRPGAPREHPGFSTATAEVVIAETGVDMSAFPATGHFASRGGPAPAGQTGSIKTRPCNASLDAVELSLRQLLTIPN